MFKKILIANRGEIAVRIIRACREMGIHAVTVYSTADRHSLHAQIADESVCIGPPATKDSYLNAAAIIEAAKMTGADAIHPGFGFLSENADFAQLCADNGITFIGPSPRAIRALGDKANAKMSMKNAGVPVIPGSDGVLKGLESAKALARQIGYPVMIKASAGGGGRGIRRVDSEAELEAAGIQYIGLPFAGSNVDLPALPAEMYGLLERKDKYVIMDIGGDDRGAYALGRYTPMILEEGDYEMYFVANFFRPLTRTAEEALQVMSEIEAAGGLRFTVINNSNLGELTTADTVNGSMEETEKLSKLSGLPIAFTSVSERTEGVINAADTLVMKLQKKPF